MPNFDKQKLTELSLLFVKAEQLMKRSETTYDGVVIPSINELRYFGYHILQAILDEEDQEAVDGQLKKAEAHAKRAIYDASESILIFYLSKAENFQNRFSESIHLTEVLPNYIELSQKLQNAKKVIEDLRERESAYKNREEYYEGCIPHLDVVIDITQKFDLAKPEIIKKDNDKEEADIKKNRNFLIMAGLTILSIIVAATFLFK